MLISTRLKNFFSSLDKPVFWLILFAVLSRFFVLGAGLYFQKNNPNIELPSGFTNQVASAWVQWDGYWYNDIVNNGYDRDFPKSPPEAEECNLGEGLCQRNFAFFPLFPLSVKLFQQVIQLVMPVRSDVLGIVLANAYFVAAAVIFFHLVSAMLGKRTAWTSYFALLVFPVSYVFSGMMSESLFFLLMVATYYLAYKKKWLWAGIVGALLSATRILGVLVIFSIVLLYWEQHKKNITFNALRSQPGREFLLSLFLIPMGLLLFILFLQNHTGDALAFISIQDYFAKSGSNLNPLAGILMAFTNYSVEGSLKNHLYNLSYFLLTMGLLIWNYFKKIIPLSAGTILIWLMIPMTAGTTLALPRYLLPLFPVYILIGTVLSKNKYLTGIYFTGSTLLLLYLINFYVSGNFLTV